MQTLIVSATWPATVLTVIGTRAPANAGVDADAQSVVAGGRAKLTSGSTRTRAWPDAGDAVSTTKASPPTASAATAASVSRRRPAATTTT